MEMTACIIMDRIEHCAAIARYLKYCCSRSLRTVHMTYDEHYDKLSKGLYNTMDLFLFELNRKYAAGYRAEGILAAKTLLSNGRLALIISPEEGLCKVNPYFWSPDDSKTLAETVDELFNSNSPWDKHIQFIEETYQDRLQTPRFHGIR